MLIIPKSKYEFKDFPLGINYIASSVRKKCPNVSCEIIDLNKNVNLKKILQEIKPQIIGLSITMPVTYEAFQIAQYCRTILPNSILVAGGPQPTIQPEVFLDSFDLVVRGEGEKSFPNIVSTWPNHNFGSIKGVCVNYLGKKIISHDIENEIHLDNYPNPLRKGMDSYTDYLFQDNIVAPVIGSRGCPYSCIFCAKEIFGNTIRFRSITKIVNELIEIKKATGISYFQFRDDIFTFNRNRVLEFGEQLMIADSSIKWLCNTRADLIDPYILEYMASTGCKRISFGVESASDAILALIKKNELLETIRLATKLCHDNKIKVKHYYMVGIPTQTIDDVIDTASFIKETKPDEIYCSIFLPYPGSRAWDIKSSLGIRFLFDIENYVSWENAYYQSNADYHQALSPIETNTMSSNQIIEARNMIWEAFYDSHSNGLQ